MMEWFERFTLVLVGFVFGLALGFYRAHVVTGMSNTTRTYVEIRGESFVCLPEPGTKEDK